MELDQLSWDVIVQRFEQFTGRKAKRAASPPGAGKTRRERSGVFTRFLQDARGCVVVT